jgi:putative endonuclease
MAEHNEIGKIGEELAVKLLRKRGCQIIARNYRRKWCEVDVIARYPRRKKVFSKSKEEVLVFVEVKTRVGERFGRPEESIDWKKRKQLVRSAEAYVSFNNYQGYYRVDGIFVVLDNNRDLARIDYYENIVGF